MSPKCALKSSEISCGSVVVVVLIMISFKFRNRVPSGFAMRNVIYCASRVLSKMIVIVFALACLTALFVEFFSVLLIAIWLTPEDTILCGLLVKMISIRVRESFAIRVCSLIICSKLVFFT